MKKIQIVGVGANVFDLLFHMDRFPCEDTKKESDGIVESGGGPCATALVASSKLGAKCAFLGNYTDDSAGNFLQADFQRFGVDTSFMKLISGKRSFTSCIWLSDEKASRTCVFNRGTLPLFSLGEKEKELIRNADILLLDGNFFENALEAAKIAKAAGTKVLLDAGRMFDGMDELLSLTDILIPSEEFALAATGLGTPSEAAQALFCKFSPELVAVTQGKKGLFLCNRDGVCHVPAFTVNAVDTNGSGDVFHGAFAFAMVKGYSHKDACIFSSAVSAIKCTRIGSRVATPCFEEVTDFLHNQGYSQF